MGVLSWYRARNTAMQEYSPVLTEMAPATWMSCTVMECRCSGASVINWAVVRSKVHLEAEGPEARKKGIKIGATAARSQQSSSHFDMCFATIKPAAKKFI